MAYVNFYKGPAASYVAETHQGGVYQCTDTGDTYVFGVLNHNSGGASGDFATQEELTQGLAGKADTVHTHAISDVTNLQDQLNGKAAASHTHTAAQVSGLADVATSGSYNDLLNKPSIPTVPSGTSNAVADYNRNTGHNTATSLSNVATSKRLVIATISSNQSFTVANNPGDGKELHIIVRNTSSSDRTVSMPTTSSYVNMSGDSLTVPANGYAEINVVFDNSYRYIRFAAQS